MTPPLVYFEFRAKVYSGKGIIQSIHSRFGVKVEGDEGDTVMELIVTLI